MDASYTVPPLEFWARVREELTQRHPSLREDFPLETSRGNKRSLPPTVVGSWAGRVWEIQFHPPRFLYPDLQVGITTSTRLVNPAMMPSERLPWLYAGERPGVFSQNVLDFDRIVMRYRRREGDFKGTLLGDAELDRRWGIYPYEDELGSVFRESDIRTILRSAADLSPNSKKSIPALAIYGTEATLTLPVTARPAKAAGVNAAFEGFGRILDRLEERRGGPSASQKPIPMDLLPDERGTPFPVQRFDCPLCGESTHPRYQVNLDTYVCERCGKVLYKWP
jgi:predicted RNA-binding Zn-ribbon protein involved in translation (DUF1610 family)